MAAPTKAEREKREKIKELGLFVRDSNIYTSFENYTRELSLYKTSYSFCSVCATRTLGNTRAADLSNEFTKNIVEKYLTKYIQKEEKELYRKLCNLSQKTYCRLLHSLMSANSSLVWDNESSYEIYNIVNKDDIVEVLGEDRANDFLLQVENIPFHSINDYYDRLTNDEIEAMKEANLPFVTLIQNRVIFPETNQYVDKNRSTYVELDFTKPLNELIEVVTNIKNDFDEDPSTVRNLHDQLGYKNKIYKCDLEDCNIYKSNNIKPIGGRLADVLFIYDCKKAGLDNDYIISEINRYWIEVKNLYKDKFQEKTLREYHNLAIDYIDNEKYKCYLSGYDIPKK